MKFNKLLLLAIIAVLGFFIFRHFDTKNGKPPTNDLKIVGNIDQNLYVSSVTRYTLKENRRACKAYQFELFNGGFNLRQKHKTFKSNYEKLPNGYELTIPLSKMDKHSDCKPSLDSIQLCISEIQTTKERCKYGTINIGGRDVLCLGKTKAPFDRCNSTVTIFNYGTPGSKLSLGYQSKTVEHLGFESGIIDCALPNHSESCIFKTEVSPATKQKKKLVYTIDVISTSKRPKNGDITRINPSVQYYANTHASTISWGHVYGADYYAIQTPSNPCYGWIDLPESNYSYRFPSDALNWQFKVVAFEGLDFNTSDRCTGKVIAESAPDGEFHNIKDLIQDQPQPSVN